MSGNPFDWLIGPPKPKTILWIWIVLILGGFGPMGVAIAVVGNTSPAEPLWSGILFWGCTLAFLGLAWCRPDLAVVPFAALFLLPMLSFIFGGRRMEYWPSRLLWGPEWPGYLLAALWLAVVFAVAWFGLIGGLRRAGFRSRSPSGDGSGSGRVPVKSRERLMIALGALFLAWTTFSAARLSIRNLAYWLAGQPDSMQLEVIGTEQVGREGRSERGVDIVIRFCDPAEHCQRIPLDDFYRREVEIHRKNDPAHAQGMRLSWNQCFIPGDVLSVQGRRDWMGMSIDHVQSVHLVEGARCE
ncbi:MAG: hypothetical protein LBL59_04190 [Xanthomonadaceae bacterium]|jgi:hypothetical protein|nr:hypothetical protein [Xanthomonadaceae bacterium]